MLGNRQKITSLEEDFAIIGLDRTESTCAVFGTLDEEVQRAEEYGDALEEALKVSKTKRMKPADKAKARATYRKQKSAIKLKKKKERKKPAFKKKQAKLKKMKKGKKAGAHKRFVVSGLDKIGNLKESLERFACEIDGNKKEEMIKAFESVKKVAGNIANKLDEAEAYVDSMIEMARPEEMAAEYVIAMAMANKAEEEGISLSGKDILDWARTYPQFNKLVDELVAKHGDELQAATDEYGDEPADLVNEFDSATEVGTTAFNLVDDLELAATESTKECSCEDASQCSCEASEGETNEIEDDLSFLDDDDNSTKENLGEMKVVVDDDDMVQAINLNNWDEVVGTEYEGKGQELTIDGQKYKVTGTTGDMVDLEPLDESNKISHNLRNLVQEADGLLDQFRTDALTPKDAEGVLKDMVSYLGGAIKSLIDITKGIKQNQAVGQDAPTDVNKSPENQSEPRKVVGQDDKLDGQDKIKTKNEKRKVAGEDDKLDGVGKKPENQSEPRKVPGEDSELEKSKVAPVKPVGDRNEVGQASIDAKLQTGTGKPDLVQVNKVGKGEVSVYESKLNSLDPFTKELCESVAGKLNEANLKKFQELPTKEMVDTAYSIHAKAKKKS